MKPFNLQEFFAHPSIKVVTRDGNPVKILCTDARSNRPVVALVEDDDCDDYLFAFLPDGKMHYGKEGPNDLLFVTKNRSGWVNVYRNVRGAIFFSTPYHTKEEAIDELYDDKDTRIDTIKVEWEE